MRADLVDTGVKSDVGTAQSVERHGVDDGGAYSGKTFGKRVGAQQHHGADFRLGKRFTHPGAVRANQVDLQFADLWVRDAHVGQLTDPGSNGVGDTIMRHLRVYNGAS